MMIVALTAQGVSFFHVRAAYPRSAETVKSSKSSHSREDAGRHLSGAVCCSPRAGGGVLSPKSILACSLLQAILFSIPMRVDRGIDREETAVAAVSERYRGDNIFG